MKDGLRSLLLAITVLAPAGAADWPQFRGPGGRGVGDEAGLPVRWGPADNVRWKVAPPGQGLSGPVVARGAVYLTACSGPTQERLHVLCYDAAAGQLRWQRQLRATASTVCHPKSNMAAPTPVTDGERVYALFATGDLACFGSAGDLLWYRALRQDHPAATNQLGLAASPVLWGDVLLLPLDNVGDSFAAGLDKLTGRTIWKVPRPREMSWATPLVMDRGGRAEILFPSVEGLAAHDPATGRRLWELPGKGLLPEPCVPSPAADGNGLVVLAGGSALRLGPGGGPPEVAWKAGRLRPAYASPLVYRDRVYALNNSAVAAQCFDAATGKLRWQERVKGPYSASPVAGDGKVYLVNEEGTTTVLEAGDRPRVLAVNALAEPVLATPALADGALFLRTERHLVRIDRPTPAD